MIFSINSPQAMKLLRYRSTNLLKLAGDKLTYTKTNKPKTALEIMRGPKNTLHIQGQSDGNSVSVKVDLDKPENHNTLDHIFNGARALTNQLQNAVDQIVTRLLEHADADSTDEQTYQKAQLFKARPPYNDETIIEKLDELATSRLSTLLQLQKIDCQITPEDINDWLLFRQTAPNQHPVTLQELREIEKAIPDGKFKLIKTNTNNEGQISSLFQEIWS